MQALNWLGRLAVIGITMGIVLNASAQRAQACSCLPPTVESSYNNNTDVARMRVLNRINLGATTLYLARVQRVFKGCLDESQLVVLSTPSSSAACGIELAINSDYLISGLANGTLFGLTRLAIGYCDYNLPWSELTDRDHNFLNGRVVCCGDACQCADGSAPVACFVDPCQVAPPCPDGRCVANYCGGCNAEFYDERGYAVCQDGGAAAECKAASDCMVTGCSGQICAPEPVITTCEWLPEYACYQDPAITSCGCDAGRCAWDETPELAACLEAAGGGLR